MGFIFQFMIYLLLVSLTWAFSFGLIKDQLTGLDSNFVAFARMSLSFLVFLPFLKASKISSYYRLRLTTLGMIQFGLMYVAYIAAYQYLKAYQVALFTILTPIYVTLIDDLIEKRFQSRFLIAAILSILGFAVIVLSDINQLEIGIGFALMQISNLAFAFGQIYYRKIMKRLPDVGDVSVFAYLYMGAVLITGIFSLFTTDYSHISLSKSQIYVLAYLGVLASGVCFFLWNLGARKTNAGILAVFNNLKIPLAVFVSLIFFNESVNVMRLLIGGVIIISAIMVANKKWIQIIKKMPS